MCATMVAPFVYKLISLYFRYKQTVPFLCLSFKLFTKTIFILYSFIFILVRLLSLLFQSCGLGLARGQSQDFDAAYAF